ncbi:hypothetical protein H4O14_14940 [Bacillus sp. PAMC26568]|nr:hypothetical protein H4O14_14940 [Bacillus sp. PAMC26568]
MNQFDLLIFRTYILSELFEGKADTAEIHHEFRSKKEELEEHINNLGYDDSEREYKEFKRDMK